jgi:predicted glycoside hydrolase/deacetylase ChbG (UPF0249 family)
MTRSARTPKRGGMSKRSSAFILCVSSITHFALQGCGSPRNASGAAAVESGIEAAYRGKVVLIVNGDDVGVTEAFTDATIDALGKGYISSASIIAPARDAGRAIGILKARPELPIGVHLSLTGDWAPLTSGASLRNASGVMWSTEREAGQNVKPEEARAEWDAQIGKVVDAGLNVTHLDSHMGCYFQTPELFAAAYALAKKYKVPLIAAFPTGQMPEAERKFLPLSSYSGIYRLSGMEETLENRTRTYWTMLGELEPGIHYIFSHHGWVPPGGKITGDLDLRIDDYGFWSSPETKKRLAEKGFVMIGCAPLREDFRASLTR